MAGLIQDLSKSKVPPGFRGRPAWFVQLWWIVQTLLFHPSPQLFYGWRRFLLRAFGARIGKGVLIRPSVTVTYPWKLGIGDWSWVGDHATLYALMTKRALALAKRRPSPPSAAALDAMARAIDATLAHAGLTPGR